MFMGDFGHLATAAVQAIQTIRLLLLRSDV